MVSATTNEELFQVAAVKEFDIERDPRRVGFSASIADATLYDLIQMQCMSSAHSVVRVSSGDDVGYLYFRSGAIVHAMSASNLGEAAALEILGWTTGSFEPCNAGWPETESIHVSPQALLLRAAQVTDESGRHNLVPFRRSRPDSAGPSRSAAAPLTRIQSAVRLDPSGALISSRGAGGEDLAEAASLANRLGTLIGETLGLDRLKAIEATGTTQISLVILESSGNLVAIRAPAEADLATVRERYGI